MKGHISMDRELFETKYWKENRAFSKFEALTWLYEQARFGFSDRIENIQGQQIVIKRGEVCFALSYFKQAWGWKSTSKVKRFFEALVQDNLISMEVFKNRHKIHLLNYEVVHDVTATVFSKKESFDETIIDLDTILNDPKRLEASMKTPVMRFFLKWMESYPYYALKTTDRKACKTIVEGITRQLSVRHKLNSKRMDGYRFKRELLDVVDIYVKNIKNYTPYGGYELKWIAGRYNQITTTIQRNRKKEQTGQKVTFK